MASLAAFLVKWNKFALLWLRFLGVDYPAVLLWQVKRPAAAEGLRFKREVEHLPRRKKVPHPFRS